MIPWDGRRRVPYPELAGGVVLVVVSFAVGKLGLFPSVALVAGGFLGGAVAGMLTSRGDAGYLRGILAAVVAAPALLTLYVVDDLVLSARYDVVLTTLGRSPDTLPSAIFVYTIYESLAILLPIGVGLITGLIGGIVGFRFRRVLPV